MGESEAERWIAKGMPGLGLGRFQNGVDCVDVTKRVSNELPRFDDDTAAKLSICRYDTMRKM